uniref:Uncharacterized protein n=1 Tax=Anguilla anguilla TaxID=7936 RepID=A0A0E9VHT4_ANGAN
MLLLRGCVYLYKTECIKNTLASVYFTWFVLGVNMQQCVS